jgi:hypothetical protein
MLGPEPKPSPAPAEAPNVPPVVAPRVPSSWTRIKTRLDVGAWFQGAKVPDRALVLMRGGPIEVYHVDGRVTTTATGDYVAEADGRFWLPKTLKRGWVRIYTENNPAPVTYREPVGYYAQDLGALGYTLPRLVGAGFEPPKKGFQVQPWMQWALIGLVALAGLAVWAYNRFG